MKVNIFKKASFWLATLVIVLPILVGLFYSPVLPDRIATHFNFSFSPDDYSSKEFAIYFIPITMLILNTILWFLMYNTPKSENINKIMFNISLWIIPIVTVLVQFIIISFSLTGNIQVVRIVPLIIGILFIILGNYLPKVKQNYIAGFRLPWTLNSEENWNRTNRLAGHLIVLLGIFTLIQSFYSNLILMVIWFIALIIAIIIPTIYSYRLYKQGI